MGGLKEQMESIKTTDSITTYLGIDSMSDFVKNDRENNNQRYKQMTDFLVFLNMRKINITLEQLYVLILNVEKRWECNIKNLWYFVNTDALLMLYNEYRNLEREIVC